MTVRELFDLFLAWCADNDRAPATRAFYRTRLRLFLAKYGDREFGSLAPLDVQAWLAAAGRQPDGTQYAPDTRRSNVVAFQRFQQWAVENGALAAPIVARLEKPRGRDRERIPTDAETARLLKNASPEFTAIYQALRQCGARPGELCLATIAHIRWEQHGERKAAGDARPAAIVLMHHKTARKVGRPRVIVCGQKLGEMLLAAIGAGTPAGRRTEGPIFLAPQGRAWSVRHLSRVYRRLRDQAGLDAALVLYSARHEHGTAICKAKGIQAAADALGHANLSTTQRYVHIDDESQRDNQDLF